MPVMFPSPAVSIVGRHDSGKTTLIVQLIELFASRGFDVGSVKHHSHVGFDIDIPGKDSYRHRHAGATETVIAAPGQMAIVKDVDGEMECADIVAGMTGHDIVIVEGYRKSGLPTIEVMRAANPADRETAAAFKRASIAEMPLGFDFVQAGRTGAEQDFSLEDPDESDVSNKMPTASTVAVVTDIPMARTAAARYGVPVFDLDDITGLADFLQEHFTRPHVSVVIQAGGESRRMGRSKATVPFAGRPLIMRMVERLLPAADELIVTTNEPHNLAFLQEEFPDAGIRLVPDALDYRGALPGLLTALQAAVHSYVAVVACDMLFASPRLIVAESEKMASTEADVVVPVNQHGFEPFHALYRRDTCLPIVEAKLAEGDKRAQAIYGDVNVCEFTQEAVLAVEPMGGCFINVNTPDELARIERDFIGD